MFGRFGEACFAARRCPPDTCLPQKHFPVLTNRPPTKWTHVRSQRTFRRALFANDVSTRVDEHVHWTVEAQKTHVR
jgi:hypothetical protein